MNETCACFGDKKGPLLHVPSCPNYQPREAEGEISVLAAELFYKLREIPNALSSDFRLSPKSPEVIERIVKDLLLAHPPEPATKGEGGDDLPVRIGAQPPQTVDSMTEGLLRFMEETEPKDWPAKRGYGYGNNRAGKRIKTWMLYAFRGLVKRYLSQEKATPTEETK